MLQRKKIRIDTANLKDVKKLFNDGVCYVYQAKERKLTELIGKFNFSIETVGITQFWEAKVNSVGIDRAIGIPYNEMVNSQCIVKINDDFYKIVKMTYKDNMKPIWWSIALERSAFNYVDETESV